ncbi:MAG: nucleoside triphosphate pyrophosphohydrolase [Candidatus Zixiibacteriota bacterium]|nr:MAG: nucleoside triphosphate pyrophosphohydrolase [candidate division Zixibacteria bacterium]
MTDPKTRVLDQSRPPFERLVLLMEILRSPEGCQWDRKQTHESLLPYLIEEAYEVVETIEDHNYSSLKEELGDLLCQIVFHAQLARERDEFSIDDSINHLITKLVSRHPHVFGERKDLEPGEVRDQWEKIKVDSGEKESSLAGLPSTMPALTMAYRIGEKAAGRGFDWIHANDVVEKIDEELRELKAEIFSSSDLDRARIENEIGDLLFAVSSLARKLGVDPEMALRRALSKFRGRFERLEAKVRSADRDFDNFTLDQLEEMWQQLKADD